MIKAENILPDFIGKLEADDYFKNVKLTRAYPDEIKPTQLKKAVVAVGLKNIDVNENSVGQDIKSGSYSVFADIFVPYSFNKQSFEEIVFRICKDISELNLVAIEISGIKADTTAECYMMKSLFTFNDEICFKGDQI